VLGYPPTLLAILNLHSNRKFHVLVEKRGFKFKDGKIMTKEAAATPGKKSAGKKKAAAEDYDTTADPTAPSKLPPAKKARSKATPKKRKIEETAEAGDEDSNAVGEMGIDEKDGIEIGESDGVKVD
jgi:hypothetical protein